jgi:hypothetical protein
VRDAAVQPGSPSIGTPVEPITWSLGSTIVTSNVPNSP